MAAKDTRRMTVPDADSARPPRVIDTGREWRMGLELVSSLLKRRRAADWPHGDGHPVLVLPGFLAGPESTVFLRSTLRRLGYRVHDWGQGRNLGLAPELQQAMQDKLHAIHDRYDAPVSLVGWSAGGIYARELARQDPDLVRCVITMGSPFRGHLEATRAWPLYRFMNRSDFAASLVTRAARESRAQPLSVPTTCIYSVTDGVVPWECCTSLPAPRTENVEVHATHLGYGHNFETLTVIADRLAQPLGHWRPYAAPGTSANGFAFDLDDRDERAS